MQNILHLAYKAFNKAINENGPVHINVSFNEPLYDKVIKKPQITEDLKSDNDTLLKEIPL